jgi:hypothetical protein
MPRRWSTTNAEETALTIARRRIYDQYTPAWDGVAHYSKYISIHVDEALRVQGL